MASKRELETMITQFKVSDLQLLLNFAGQNSKGRKSDLQRKVLTLIRQNISMPLEMKIRTMYRQMLIESQKQLSNDYNYYRPNCDRYGSYCNNNASAYATQPVASMSYDSYNAKQYYQNHNGNGSYYDECMRKHSHVYTPINYNQQQNRESSVSPLFDYMSFLEPGTHIPDAKSLKDAKFKKLSFYRYDQTVVPLMPMKPQHKFSDVFDYSHSFTVSEQAHNFLTWPKKNEKESRFQLQLRICVLDQATLNNLSEVADSLPLALSVKVNDKSCQLPPAIPSTNKTGMLLKRMNAPINITSQSSKKSQLNSLSANWSIECNKLYAFTVHLVEKYTSDELIERLKRTKKRSSEVTRKYIHSQLNDDDDIAATSLKVSLICPLGKILMSLPARASTCNHIQCFDASLYIKMNEVKSVWQCPVCNSSCFYEDLFIDEYFVDVLKSGQFSSNVSEVQINNDGSWEPVTVKKRKASDAETSTVKKKIRVADEECEKRAETPAESRSVEEICNEKIHREPLFSIVKQNVHEDKKESSRACCTPSVVSTSDKVSANNDAHGIHETSNSTENNNSSKMNVLLVDLTSDEESEECNLPLNLKKSESTNDLQSDPASSPKVVPPIYDIDDSDEHS